MHTRSRLLFLPLSLLACAATAISAATGASAGTPAGQAPSKPLSRHLAGPPAASLASTVETLGTKRFQSAYGGQELSPSGSLTVYVVAAHGAGFLSAMRDEAARSAAAAYEVAYVPHSWAQLDALTMRIARQEPGWRARGIRLAQWGPDAASSKVTITLRSYTGAAERELLATYGAGWVSVSHEPLNEQAVLLANKYYDSAPFYGGDRIFNSDETLKCTDGFTMRGNNNPSNHWATTAGHCGSRTWYTNFTHHYTLGATSTNYFRDFGGSTYTDTQTIGPVNAWGTVWGADSSIYFPYTTYHPAAGEQICFDGATPKPNSAYGIECNVSVASSGPFCDVFEGHQECNLGRAHDSSREICLPGDSGGPVFQRTSGSSNVKAVGTITAGTTDGHTCWYTLIGAIESVTNTHLDTNPAG